MAAVYEKPAACKAGELMEYEMTDGELIVTDEMKAVFNWDGGFIVKGLLNAKELAHIETSLKSHPEFLSKAIDLSDGMGKASRMLLWNQPGSDITGMVARCVKVARTSEQLLGGEVYHYHTKLMMKEPRTGGAHLWHQDYGYWYKNGVLRPDLLTVFIAVDPCVKANGCLQVWNKRAASKILPGSQRSGRIDHDLVAGQTRANTERVEALKEHYGLLHVEMEPGDALFFHCNLLHTSDQNNSDLRRWAFLCAYNRKDNNPIIKHHHPQYTPLMQVPNDAILACTETDISDKDIMDPSTDKTTKGKLVESGYH